MSKKPKQVECATAPDTPDICEREMHLVCSSGGSRAILASAGVLLAADYAGIKSFKSVGGVSGGSIPTALYASGMDARACLEQALSIDFQSLLTRRASYWQILVALMWQRRNEKVRPIDGVMTSEKLGDFIKSIGGQDAVAEIWPKGYWTIGISEKSEIVFTETGIFEVGPDRMIRVISGEPGDLGKAVRGSCAVPGFISAVEYDGMYLFDGALGTEGRCPVNVPKRFYGAKRSNIIACDVGDDSEGTSARIASLWKLLCGAECVPEIHEPDYDTDGNVIVVRPKITSMRSLQFSLTDDQKWQAVMAGFVDAIPEFANAGLLSKEKLSAAAALSREYTKIQKKATTGKKRSPAGQLSTDTRKLLESNSLL